MLTPILSIGRLILATLRDLAPIIVVIAFFQLVVLQQPFPDPAAIVGGLALIMVGLAMFVQGLEMGLFPLGAAMAGPCALRGKPISSRSASTVANGCMREPKALVRP